MHILIIDDDKDDTDMFCEVLKELLPDAKCSVSHTCSKIKQTIEKLGIPDIIFMDGHMYPMNGKECLIELNSFLDRSRTKIVIHSGSINEIEGTELKKLGIDHILIKADSYEGWKSNLREIVD